MSVARLADLLQLDAERIEVGDRAGQDRLQPVRAQEVLDRGGGQVGRHAGEIADQLGKTWAVTEKHYVKPRSRNQKAAAARESIKPTRKAAE